MKSQGFVQSMRALATVATGIVVAVSSFSASAQKGRIGDGSGDIEEDRTVSGPRIVEWLEGSKIPMLYSLYFLELTLEEFAKDNLTGANDVSYRTIYRKLFLSKKTMYQALKEAQWDPIDLGSCETPGNPEEKDANSLRNWPKVCFSLERLSRMKQRFGKTQLMALIAHELAHVSGDSLADGATEDEAKAVQSLVQSQLSDSALDNASSVGMNFRKGIRSLIESFQGLADIPAKVPKAEMAKVLISVSGQNVTEMMNLLNGMSGNAPQLGIMPISNQSLTVFYGSLLKALNIMYFAYGTDASVKKAFGKRTQMSLEEYAKATNNLQDTKHLDQNIRLITRVPSESFKAEVQDIVKLLEKILESATPPFEK